MPQHSTTDTRYHSLYRCGWTTRLSAHGIVFVCTGSQEVATEQGAKRRKHITVCCVETLMQSRRGLDIGEEGDGEDRQIAHRGSPLHVAMWGIVALKRILIDHDAYQGKLVPVCVSLIESTFATAWAEGQAMRLKQAIAYALEETTPAEP